MVTCSNSACSATDADDRKRLRAGRQCAARHPLDIGRKRSHHGVFVGAVKGRQSLNLQGRLENPDPEQLTVPQIRFQGDDLKVSRLQLYRQPAVLIDLPPTQGVVAGETTEGDARKNLGALVGCYTIEDPQVPIEVHLRPNAYKAKAATVTHLLHDADRWMAEVECHFEVSDGLADSLQFEIPPQWSEPYRLEPPLSFKIVPVPGEQRRAWWSIPCSRSRDIRAQRCAAASHCLPVTG